MSKLVSILIASVFAVAGANAFADEGDCPPRSKQTAEVRDLVAHPTEDKIAQRQCREWQRKWAGIPKEEWDKMTDAQKTEAFEKARAGKNRNSKGIADAQGKAGGGSSGDGSASRRAAGATIGRRLLIAK